MKCGRYCKQTAKRSWTRAQSATPRGIHQNAQHGSAGSVRRPEAMAIVHSFGHSLGKIADALKQNSSNQAQA